MKRIVINKLLEYYPGYDFSGDVVIVNPEKTDELIQIILNIKDTYESIEIFDITRGSSKENIFEVRDHINRTGSNPLIGRQKQLRIDFPDLSNLYENKNGIVTDCLGNRFNDGSFKYPSTWLCHISIIARAIGKLIVRGKLINIT